MPRLKEELGDKVPKGGYTKKATLVELILAPEAEEARRTGADAEEAGEASDEDEPELGGEEEEQDDDDEAVVAPGRRNRKAASRDANTRGTGSASKKAKR